MWTVHRSDVEECLRNGHADCGDVQRSRAAASTKLGRVLGAFEGIFSDTPSDNALLRVIPEGYAKESVNQLAGMLRHQKSPNQSALANAFSRIDGGLVSMVVTDHEIRTPDTFDEETYRSQLPDEEELEVARRMHRIEHTFETLAIGLYLSSDAGTLGIRMRLGCENPKDTSILWEDVQSLFELHRKELPNFDIEPDYSDMPMLGVRHQFIGRSVLDLIKNSDGTSDVSIRTTIDLPESPATLLAQAIGQEFNVTHE